MVLSNNSSESPGHWHTPVVNHPVITRDGPFKILTIT